MVRGTDEGKVVKISSNYTAALCSDGDIFHGVVESIDHNALIGVIALAGFKKLSYSGDAPALGLQELVANGAGGVRKPGDGVRAYLVTGLVASNNAIRFTAKDIVGPLGHDITIELKDPSGNSKSLSVGVEGEAITVNLATGETGVITSTAAEIIAAIAASGAAGIVTAANEGESTGNGVVSATAKSPLAGGVAEGAGRQCLIAAVIPAENALYARL
jgi:hypothetical protein